MIEREFIKKCVDLGVPQDMAEKYVMQTMKDYYTEYDIKAVREAADYEGEATEKSCYDKRSEIPSTAGGEKMIAKKCDRCGKFYDTYNSKSNINKTSGIMFLNIDERGQYFSHNAIDLCPECMAAVKNFVQGVAENG